LQIVQKTIETIENICIIGTNSVNKEEKRMKNIDHTQAMGLGFAWLVVTGFAVLWAGIFGSMYLSTQWAPLGYLSVGLVPAAVLWLLWGTYRTLRT
jgi:hypothetical protein